MSQPFSCIRAKVLMQTVGLMQVAVSYGAVSQPRILTGPTGGAGRRAWLMFRTHNPSGCGPANRPICCNPGLPRAATRPATLARGVSFCGKTARDKVAADAATGVAGIGLRRSLRFGPPAAMCHR